MLLNDLQEGTDKTIKFTDDATWEDVKKIHEDRYLKQLEICERNSKMVFILQNI